MTVTLLYIFIVRGSEPERPVDFDVAHRRFAESYRRFKPAIPHELRVVCYNGERTSAAEGIFKGLDVSWAYYVGDGFDMGSLQAVGSTLDCDLVVGLNSQIYFHRNGWLERLVDAFKQYGHGLFGPMGSYENTPHLRGPCMAMPPSLLRAYPFKIDSRANCHRAESGDMNFTQWVRRTGKPAIMVTWDEMLWQKDWRQPSNIFRRGDQSNCIMWDKHSKVYADLPEGDPMRRGLERAADGQRIALRVSPKTITVVTATNVALESHAVAIDRTAKAIPYPCERLLLSPEKPENYDGGWKSLPTWMPDGKWTLEDMCNFLMYGLHEHITTDLAVLVHWDGYAINPKKWSDQFLSYDYVGAPWPRAFTRNRGIGRVGNGGFSIRSKKWLNVASTLPKPPKEMSRSEDLYQCDKHLSVFRRAGCRIAPLSIAMRWSLEFPVEEFPRWKLADSFGFHGRTRTDPARRHLHLPGMDAIPT